MVLWLLPAVAGALASWDAVRLKREPYRRHYVSTHFGTSAAGMVLFFIVAFAIILLMQQSLPEALVPWVYPLTVAGIPLTIISMGMTWQGLGLRKVGSFAAALVMPILMVLLVLGGARITDPSGAPDLGGIRLFVLTFVIGALTSEIAGSLLHLIASARAEIEAKAEELRLRGADITTLKTEHEKMRKTLNAREPSLAEREREVKRTSIDLTSQLRSAETKAKSVEEREARLQELEKSFDSKRTSLLKKEKELELKDSELRLKGEQVEATHGGADATRIRELKEWEKKILAKEKELGKQEVELKTMETRLKERYENATRVEKQFQGQRRMFDDRESEYVSREKKISDQEAALRERSTEIERQASAVEEAQHQLENKTREGRARGMRDMGREGQLEEWERRLREREEDLKRRTYQKEKEMEMREGAVKARITTPAGEAEAEEAIAVEKKADRVKTGTPRLDDLLYGGIPFNSNVLFVGPAFVGKEVALLNFIAEGLKKGIPVIIITTTKLPIDIARDIAPILPTFVEYDQLGLVRWIDCTSPVSGKPVKEKNVWRVNGPTDFDSIYQLVGQLDDEFKKKALMIGSFQLERIR